MILGQIQRVGWGLLLLAPLLAACPKRVDPLQVSNQQMDTRAPVPHKGSMSLNIVAPRWGVAGTTPATLVVQRPDGFYLQIRGPLGGVILETAAASDGFSVISPGKEFVLHDDDPDAALLELTRGALGLDGVLALLCARLPEGAFDYQEQSRSAGQILLEATAPQGHRVSMTVDGRSGMLSAARLTSADGEVLLDIVYEGQLRDERVLWPETMALSVPPMEIKLRARYRKWQVLDGAGDLFHLSPPADFQVRSLQDTIEALSADEPPADSGTDP